MFNLTTNFNRTARTPSHRRRTASSQQSAASMQQTSGDKLVEYESHSEILSALLQKERTIYYSKMNCDYLLDICQEQQAVSIEKVAPPTSSMAINEADRTKLVDWCYRVIDLFQLEREVVAMAMDLVDRFLSKSNTCDLAYKVMHDRVQFQLLTMTALYIAIRVTNELFDLSCQKVKVAQKCLKVVNLGSCAHFH